MFYLLKDAAFIVSDKDPQTHTCTPRTCTARTRTRTRTADPTKQPHLSSDEARYPQRLRLQARLGDARFTMFIAPLPLLLLLPWLFIRSLYVLQSPFRSLPSLPPSLSPSLSLNSLPASDGGFNLGKCGSVCRGICLCVCPPSADFDGGWGGILIVMGVSASCCCCTVVRVRRAW